MTKTGKIKMNLINESGRLLSLIKSDEHFLEPLRHGIMIPVAQSVKYHETSKEKINTLFYSVTLAVFTLLC